MNDKEVIYELIVYLAIIIAFLIFAGIGIFLFVMYLSGKVGV